jgi:predicted HTH transcriptional regulator
MALRHLPLDQIDQAQLQRLIDGRTSETRDIEYKRDTYGNADKDYGEFLADVSSFANTVGGDLIVGMSASAGVPASFSPLQIDCDAEILRLENIARSGLQPRISGFAMRAIPIQRGGSVLVIRIPRSYNQPHRIIRQGNGNNRFYARSSAGKYEPNVDELRQLFAQAPQLADVSVTFGPIESQRLRRTKRLWLCWIPARS